MIMTSSYDIISRHWWRFAETFKLNQTQYSTYFSISAEQTFTACVTGMGREELMSYSEYPLENLNNLDYVTYYDVINTNWLVVVAHSERSRFYQ